MLVSMLEGLKSVGHDLVCKSQGGELIGLRRFRNLNRRERRGVDLALGCVISVLFRSSLQR